MNDDASVDDATAITTEAAEDNISLGDFTAKLHGEPAPAAAVTEPAEPSEPEPIHHRSKKQRARAGDVPRIAELTRRLRETEAERDALKSTPAPVVAPAVAKTSVDAGNTAVVVPPPPARAAASVPVKAAGDDPEPDPTKYDDWTKYQRDLSLWGGREALRTANAEHEQATRAETQRQEAVRLETQWTAGVAAAKAKYPDFEAIAFAPTQIPKGSLVDAWILEHKNGPDVLYHMQRTPTELHAMLAMPLFEQVEALTLLSQRLSGSRTAAVVTGAAPAPLAQPVSRPPTPVRTGPMRAADEPPDPDASTLSDFTRYHGTPRSRRARS